MLSQYESSTNLQSEANDEVDINYVYGVVQVSTWSKIPDDLDLAEEYYKSERHEKNEMQGMKYDVKASNCKGIPL